MATIAQHNAARNDYDLLARFVGAAEQAGVPSAQMWAEQHRGALVSTQIGDTTVSDVFAFAVSTYNPTPRPGENPAAVTDAQIAQAVQAVKNATP